MSMEQKTVYMPVAVSPDLKRSVQSVAKQERRSMSQQAGELIELGLAEYERRQAAENIAAGKTQIDPRFTGRKSGA